MSSQGIAARADRLGERAKDHRTASRMEKLDRDNERLRAQVELLRDDLSEERSILKEASKGLSVASRRRRVKTTHPLRMIVIAGGAYLLGSKAGRERYEQIMTKVRSLSQKARVRVQEDRPEVWMTESDDVAPSPNSGASRSRWRIDPLRSLRSVEKTEGPCGVGGAV